MAGRALVSYHCVRAEHRRIRPRNRVGTITVHAGEWAYCHADEVATPHEWRWTGGVSMAELSGPDHDDDALAGRERRPLDDGSTTV